MRSLLLSLAMLLTLAGCAGPVAIDYDAGASFMKYRTYAFAPAMQKAGYLSLDGARIQAAARNALNQRGYREVPADKADMLVRYRINEVKSLDNSGVSVGFGTFHHPLGFGMMTAPPTRIIKQGQLVIELEDAGRHQVIWSATSRRLLDTDMKPVDRSRRIREIVNDMFSRFPP